MCILVGRNGVKDVYNEKHSKEKSYAFMLEELIMAGTDESTFSFRLAKCKRVFFARNSKMDTQASIWKLFLKKYGIS